MNDVKDDVMLTTFDNPFNPFEEFEAWWKNDLRLGHDCCGTLARMANTSPTLSDEINNEYIRKAMENICSNQPLIYKIVSREDYGIQRSS